MQKTKTHSVFVYGTLKDKNSKDEYFVKGKLYNIGYFPGIILSNNGNFIPGQVKNVSDERLDGLDKYEGVPNLYTREKTEYFKKENGSFVKQGEAWIYQWASSVKNLEEIDSWKL